MYSIATVAPVVVGLSVSSFKGQRHHKLTMAAHRIRCWGMDLQSLLPPLGEVSRPKAQCYEPFARHLGVDARTTTSGEQETARQVWQRCSSLAE
jgi:hypothetical protein